MERRGLEFPSTPWGGSGGVSTLVNQCLGPKTSALRTKIRGKSTTSTHRIHPSWGGEDRPSALPSPLHRGSPQITNLKKKKLSETTWRAWPTEDCGLKRALSERKRWGDGDWAVLRWPRLAFCLTSKHLGEGRVYQG